MNKSIFNVLVKLYINKFMSIGFWQIAIVVVLVVLLFGRGKISSLMGDVAKGIKSFKKGMSDNNEDSSTTTSSHEDTSKEDKDS